MYEYSKWKDFRQPAIDGSRICYAILDAQNTLFCGSANIDTWEHTLTYHFVHTAKDKCSHKCKSDDSFWKTFFIIENSLKKIRIILASNHADKLLKLPRKALGRMVKTPYKGPDCS
jgi:hypothetical protein